MSNLKLSQEQLEFVNNKSGNMLVSASAGSGKTTTMITKLINLIISEKVPVKNLLVVTFTEAAASEMKQKLYFELINEIKNFSFTDEQLAYFYEQLDDIMVADIGTLHSVCKKIISKYFYEINIEPAFKILANDEYESLFITAINNVFNKYIENNNEDFYKLYESFSEKRNTAKLKSLVTELYNFLLEQTDAEVWFNKILKAVTNDNLNKNICAKYLFDYYHSIFWGYFENLKKLKESASIIDEKLFVYITQILNILGDVFNANNFESFNYALFKDLSFPVLRAPKDNPCADDLFYNLKTLMAEIKKTLLKAKDNFITDNLETLKITSRELSNYYIIIYKIVESLNIEFSRLKQNIGAVDFSDLQKFALKILSNANIKKELQENYRYIFVDEYQDINSMQEEIILNLTSNNNLYMIGDVKQSIYAFRQCKPEIFLSKYNNFLSDGINNKVLKLNDNYRSNIAVINFANFIFDEIITTSTIGINYKKDARLNSKINNFGEVKLCVLNTEIVEEDTESTESEAFVVLNQICELLGKSFINHRTNKEEKIEYKDIAILTRDSGNFVSSLYKILTNNKVPVSVSFKQSLFKSLEVNLLYSLLKILANPSLEVELATVLLSPMFELSNNDLAEIKLNSQFDNLYESIFNYKNIDINGSLSDKLSIFIKDYNNLQEKLVNFKINELIEFVVNYYDLNNYYLSLPEGETRISNIKQFITLLSNAGFDYNLSGALEFLDGIKQKDNFLTNVEGGENSVKILTMHKSKGLEYPAVIIANMGKSFNKVVYRSDLVITEKFGLGINYKDTVLRTEIKTLQKNANVLYKLNNELEEQIRLLYVAITRAKNYLVLVGNYNLKNFEINMNKNIYSATNFLDFVFKAFKTNKHGFVNKLNKFEIKLDNSKVQVEIQDVNSVNSELQVIHKKVEFEKTNDELTNQLIKNINVKNKSNEFKIATKSSVSGLLNGDDDYLNISENQLEIGRTILPKSNLSLDIGNAYHLIMQNLNYNENLADIENLIDKLVKNNKVTKEVANYVSGVKILNAVNKIKNLFQKNSKILKEQQFLLNIPYNKIVTNTEFDNKVLIQGVVDLIIIDDKKAILVDFKTNKNTNINELKEKYNLQLTCYKQAIQEGLNVEVSKKYLYLFESNELILI